MFFSPALVFLGFGYIWGRFNPNRAPFSRLGLVLGSITTSISTIYLMANLLLAVLGPSGKPDGLFGVLAIFIVLSFAYFPISIVILVHAGCYLGMRSKLKKNPTKRNLTVGPANVARVTGGEQKDFLVGFGGTFDPMITSKAVSDRI